MTLASAYYTTNQARSAFYPNLTLSGSAGWTNALGQVVTNPGGWILSAVASLTQPIFNRGKLVSNLRVSKDEEQIALLNYKQTLLDAGQEVSDALYAVESAQRNLDIHQSSVASWNVRSRPRPPSTRRAMPPISNCSRRSSRC